MKTVRQRGLPEDSSEEWLLMVHMLASAPNLQKPLGLDLEELSRPLKEMQQRARVVDVRVQVDLPTGVSKRFQLTCDETRPLGIRRTRPDTTLSSFVQESMEDKDQNKKKVNTALVVWGHASGISQGLGRAYASVSNSLGVRVCPAPGPGQAQMRRSKARNSKPGQRAADDLAQELLAPDEVAQAGSVWGQLTKLPQDRKLDLVGFDACYMACVEIAYELRNHVDFLLAPQPGIGLEGWHYDLFLDQIIAGTNGSGSHDPITPEELGRRVVAQVGLAASSPQALSLLNLEHLRKADPEGHLVDRIKVLTAALQRAYDAPFRESQMRRLVLDSFNGVAWAGVRQFLDLGDLCRVLASRIPDHNVRAAALAVMSGIAPTTLVGKTGSSSGTFRTSGLLLDHLCVLDVPLSGLSIYCPWPRASARLADVGVRNVEVDPREYHRDPDQPARYPGLEFSSYTGWGDFIFDSVRGQEAERRWVRQEAREQVLHAVAERDGSKAWPYGTNGWTPFARADDPKPAGRADDPKPAGRADDPKPAGRADDPKPAGRDDAWTF